jgi:hypothetical protein
LAVLLAKGCPEEEGQGSIMALRPLPRDPHGPAVSKPGHRCGYLVVGEPVPLGL